jgi:mono/diheme cytochrome c family protein
MPAWGGTLPAEAIWRLVSYIQSLQPAKDTLSTTTW